MTQMLVKESYVVLTAEDGNNVMEVAKLHAIDLLLSGVNVPGMNGISLVAKLHLPDGHDKHPSSW